MGKLTISMAIFNSYVKLPEGRSIIIDMNTRPGKRLQKTMGKIHHAIHGKIHEISMVIFHSYVKLPEGRYDTITVIYLLVLGTGMIPNEQYFFD